MGAVVFKKGVYTYTLPHPKEVEPICVFQLENTMYDIPGVYCESITSYIDLYKAILKIMKTSSKVIDDPMVDIISPTDEVSYGEIRSIRLDTIRQTIEVSVATPTDDDLVFITTHSDVIRMIPKLTMIGDSLKLESMHLYHIDQHYAVIQRKKQGGRKPMNKNMIIGIGNCGAQIVNAISKAPTFMNSDALDLYAIDSTLTSVDHRSFIKFIPIISDEKSGSGRNRERGKAMYKYHESNGAFKEMYEDAAKAKSPVIVITSAAGGTGSGAIVPLCEALIAADVQVIPIIICPNKGDPDAYHLNTNDLLLELNEAGITTYSIFENSKGDADYTPINNEVVSAIEIIFGKKYEQTTLDSIDDSDLDTILSTPGRFIAIDVTANDVDALQKILTQRVFSGFQPGWTLEEAKASTFMTAYSLKSMFARQDFKKVFAEVNNRIVNVFDEYRNIVDSTTDGTCHATLIVAGLPRHQIKMIDTEYKEADTIGSGVNRAKRPSFLNKKKATITQAGDKNDVLSQFNWK